MGQTKPRAVDRSLWADAAGYRAPRADCTSFPSAGPLWEEVRKSPSPDLGPSDQISSPATTLGLHHLPQARESRLPGITPELPTWPTRWPHSSPFCQPGDPEIPAYPAMLPTLLPHGATAPAHRMATRSRLCHAPITGRLLCPHPHPRATTFAFCGSHSLRATFTENLC